MTFLEFALLFPSSTASLKGSTGHLKAIKTTRLFTVEETMEAMRKASSVSFQAPSQG
jgi:hypothetical protein